MGDSPEASPPVASAIPSRSLAETRFLDRARSMSSAAKAVCRASPSLQPSPTAERALEVNSGSGAQALDRPATDSQDPASDLVAVARCQRQQTSSAAPE